MGHSFCFLLVVATARNKSHAFVVFTLLFLFQKYFLFRKGLLYLRAFISFLQSDSLRVRTFRWPFFILPLKVVIPLLVPVNDAEGNYKYPGIPALDLFLFFPFGMVDTSGNPERKSGGRRGKYLFFHFLVTCYLLFTLFCVIERDKKSQLSAD